jgi:hypothetical protein
MAIRTIKLIYLLWNRIGANLLNDMQPARLQCIAAQCYKSCCSRRSLVGSVSGVDAANALGAF